MLHVLDALSCPYIPHKIMAISFKTSCKVNAVSAILKGLEDEE